MAAASKVHTAGRSVLLGMALWFGTGALLWAVIFLAGRIGVTP